MKSFSDIVQKIVSKFFSEELKKNQIKQILFQETKFDFKPEELELRDDKLFIKTSSVVKSEILIKKEKILNRIKEEGFFVKEIF